ncbi:MAG: cation:proton antiporter [Methanomassiliicoccus sp.]|nr:cation:proton antiporter [Methanomassiliicoccus sp.]
MEESTLMFEIGAMLIIAFIGALLASKAKQSAILGYIAAGIVIGPYLTFQIGGFTYSGLVQDIGLIETMAQLGLYLLIFFVGMEFSAEKIRRVKGPAVVLSLIDVGVNLFTGILLATAMGWPLIDSIFLASVLAMSCSAVAMKTLMELGRLERPETEFMLGMIIMEEFISMLFLTIVGGLVIHTDSNFSLERMVFGLVVFFTFSAVMIAVVIPRTIARLQMMKSDELFVLFMLGAICLSAAFAELCGVPALIGAFFIGMSFAETKVMKRSEKIITPLRDAFVAMFFVSFGMLIDPSLFGSVITIIVISVVIIIIDEILIMSAVAYIVGFGRRAATSVGASFSARGGESIMYASVGSHAAGATKGAELYPIAGAVTFLMSVLCPLFIRKSFDLADGVAKRAPRSLVYGGAVLSRTLNKVVMPGSKLFVLSRPLLASFIVFLCSVLMIISVRGPPLIFAYLVAIASCAVVWVLLGRDLRGVVEKVDYHNLGTMPGKERAISQYVAAVVVLALLMVVHVALLFALYWPSVMVLAVAYLLWMFHLMTQSYRRTCDTVAYDEIRARNSQPPVPLEIEKPAFNHRERWRELQ